MFSYRFPYTVFQIDANLVDISFTGESESVCEIPPQ